MGWIRPDRLTELKWSETQKYSIGLWFSPYKLTRETQYPIAALPRHRSILQINLRIQLLMWAIYHKDATEKEESTPWCEIWSAFPHNIGNKELKSMLLWVIKMGPLFNIISIVFPNRSVFRYLNGVDYWGGQITFVVTSNCSFFFRNVLLFDNFCWRLIVFGQWDKLLALLKSVLYFEN